VRLNDWFRWWMLKEFLQSKVSERTMRKRLGWSKVKLGRVLFASHFDLTLDDLAVWFFAIDGRLLDFKLEDMA
jgi:hypothetical protein